jgi:hypothetical protein
MKNNRLSKLRRFAEGEFCAYCAIGVTIIAVVVIWQVIGMLYSNVQDFVKLDDIYKPNR